MRKEIRLGTRASALALWQAEWVKSELEKKYAGNADFKEYKKRTSVLIPMPPEKE